MKIQYKYIQSKIFTVSSLPYIFLDKETAKKKVYPRMAHDYFLIHQTTF